MSVVSIVVFSLAMSASSWSASCRRAGRGADVVLDPEQVLELVPAGPRRVVLVGEVVDAGVDGAVDVLDQTGDGLDASPTPGGTGRRRPWPPGTSPARTASVNTLRSVTSLSTCWRTYCVYWAAPSFTSGSSDDGVRVDGDAGGAVGPTGRRAGAGGRGRARAGADAEPRMSEPSSLQAATAEDDGEERGRRGRADGGARPSCLATLTSRSKHRTALRPGSRRGRPRRSACSRDRPAGSCRGSPPSRSWSPRRPVPSASCGRA